MTLHGRDFLKEADFTPAELDGLLRLAADLKAERRAGREEQRLRGRNIALIFEKTSTRTRTAFEVAMYDQGGHVTVLDPSASQIGHKESIADTARVLTRIYDGIEYRGSAQAVVEELAAYASVPVYNGLTDEWHPTQMLADFLTMREHAQAPEEPLRYCYLGDARSNMGNSLLVMGALMGADVRIVAPRELWPSDDVQTLARQAAHETGAAITLTTEPDEGVPGAEFVHTDVWVSMGEPKDVWADRVEQLRPYRVDTAMMARTGSPTAKFMHCLPAYHDRGTAIGHAIAEDFGLVDGVEVSDEVFESPASIVFDQAENRMHTIKAVLVATLA
ncbi:MAG: ornithine carbamoyltransferase [Actinomycetales bacterium]|nr:ornithine carbamoyltransferase [Actinomycetales bacterium]